MPSPLLRRLIEELGYPELDETSLVDFLEQAGNSVLFFAGDPKVYPESNDVAVILPELMKLFGDRLRAAVIAQSAQQALHKRFGFSAWPSLVFMRGKDYLGAISRVQDWHDYIADINQILASEPKRPPGVGIPVRGDGGPNCH